MPDVFTKKKRSEVMSRIRSCGNKDTEIVLMRLLRATRITGWRRHLQIRGKVPGRARHSPACGTGGGQRTARPTSFCVRPDFVFSQARVALFVDGCFWHGCPRHSNLPVGNRAFWRKKLATNHARDRLVNRRLRQLGWRVLRLWEHELRDPSRCLKKIVRVMGE